MVVLQAHVLPKNTLTIAEGAKVILNSTMLQVDTMGVTSDSSLVLTATNVQHGFFEIISNPGVPITNFTQQKITDSEIRFVHDGGDVPPFYEVKVSDGVLETSYVSASITFININDNLPVLGNNQLIINEGQTAVLTPTMLNATDLDNDDATLIFTINSVQYGQFERVSNPGVVIISFTQQEIINSDIQFAHDGGELAPTYEVKVSDGLFETSYESAAITFNTVPVLENNQLIINEGQTAILTPTMLSATDVDNDDTTLNFTVDNIQQGQFEKVSNPGVAITSFTQQEIIDSDIQFVHDGGEIAPAYEVKVSDGILETGYQSATITYTPVNDQPPVLGNNQLPLSDGQTVTLTTDMLSATDPDSDDALLLFTVNDVENGRFESIELPGDSYYQFYATRDHFGYH